MSKPDKNKTVSVGANKMTVLFTNTRKHFVYQLEKDSPTREITLFGKKLNDIKATDVKEDFLKPAQRQYLNDLLYARQKLSKEEIAKLPLSRQYYVRVVSKNVERALHKWKCEIVNNKIDSLLLKLFPKSNTVKAFVELSSGEKPEVNPANLTIFDLVTEREIVGYLQANNLFPQFKQ